MNQVLGSVGAVLDRPQGSGSAAEVAQAVGEGVWSGLSHGHHMHGATSSGVSCSSWPQFCMVGSSCRHLLV